MVRITQSVKTEIIETAEINGWRVFFTYKGLSGEQPNEFNVTGNKIIGAGSFQYNRGTGVDGFQFMSGAPYDQDLVAEILSEINLILA